MLVSLDTSHFILYCNIYHRHKCRCLQLGFESHCLLWFNTTSCAQHCVRLPPISQHFLYIWHAHSQHALKCSLVNILLYATHRHCNHMDCIVCTCWVAGMGLQARLVLPTCIRVWSHGTCMACKASLFYHAIHVYCNCIGGGVSWLKCEVVCIII